MTEIVASTTHAPVTLEALANHADAEHRECFAAARSVLTHAIAAGEALLRAKAALAHGEWGPWVQENLTFSHSTAAAYMLVARHQTYLMECGDVTSLSGAIVRLRDAELTDPRGPKRRLGPGSRPASPVGAGMRQHGERIGITDEMVERLAGWMMVKWGRGKPVTEQARRLAHDALLVTFTEPTDDVTRAVHEAAGVTVDE